MITEINKSDALTLLDMFKNRIVSVEFVKKNGETRRLVCRAGVKKYLTTGARKMKRPDPKKYKTMFDIQKHAYRMFDVDRLLTVKAGGHKFIVR